mgnify:CR=1 FL=1
MSEGLVLDSYALMAHLMAQLPGAAVRDFLQRADSGELRLFMSVVNLGEVLYTVERRKGLTAAQDTLSAIEELPIVLEEATKTQALLAARFKAQFPIAYADCFALALAQSKGLPVLTGDPEFAKAEDKVAVQWLKADGG